MMGMIDNLIIMNEKFINSKPEALDTYKNLVFFIVLIDVVGVFWFLKYKSLGIAILLVLMGVLVYILIIERRVKNKMVYDEEDVEEDTEDENDDEYDDEEEDNRPLKKSKKKKVESSTSSNEMDFQLPSSEEYNKRVEKAFGTIGNFDM